MSVYILSLLVPRHLSRHAQLTHRAERDHCQRQLSHGLSPFPVDPVRNAKVALYELPTLQVSFPECWYRFNNMLKCMHCRLSRSEWNHLVPVEAKVVPQCMQLLLVRQCPDCTVLICISDSLHLWVWYCAAPGHELVFFSTGYTSAVLLLLNPRRRPAANSHIQYQPLHPPRQSHRYATTLRMTESVGSDSQYIMCQSWAGLV